MFKHFCDVKEKVEMIEKRSRFYTNAQKEKVTRGFLIVI